jgi:dsRNA-specific ribonuclease
MNTRKIFTIATDRSNIVLINNLKDLILNVLKNILPESEAKKYVSVEYMPIWQRAFTNETFDPTINYEDDEYVGDRIMKILYPKYVNEREPNYTPMDISNIDMLVMEKKNQYDLSFELGFINFIQLPHHQSVPVGVGGDVFESFFGALDEVSDLIMPDMGLINGYNMITYIFNQNKMPDELRLGNTKMIVEQIFIQLGLKIEPVITENNNTFTAEINLNQKQLEFFNQYDINLPITIGKGIARSTKPALKIAYDQAIITLEKYNVNQEFINKIKQLRKIEQQEKHKVEIEKEIIVLDIPVKELILTLLEPIIVQESVIKKFVSDENMALWNSIFDDTIVSNVDQKLIDKFYFFGEILIKGLLAKNLMALFRDDDYHKEDYNNILSNIVQNYNIFLQDKPFIFLMNDRKLEAFFGIVDYISDQLLMGSGMINCNRLVKGIFHKDLIPYEYKYTHPKTVVEQLFSPFFGQKNSKPDVVYEFDEENSEHSFKISLTDDQFDFLHKYGYKIKIPLIGESVGKLKNVTQKEAYNKALTTLNKYGVSKQELNKIKNKLDFQNPKLAVYNALLEKKRIEDGFDYFYFASPTKTKTLTEATIQLVGVKGNKKTILSSVVEPPNTDKITSKVNLVKIYLGY